MQAGDARNGDVLLDGNGQCWLRGFSRHTWSTFSGMLGFYGPWKDEYGPQGELTLLVRDGRLVPSVAADGENKPADA
jgi:hypothetical protein